jgi:hypothetical protein
MLLYIISTQGKKYIKYNKNKRRVRITKTGGGQRIIK